MDPKKQQLNLPLPRKPGDGEINGGFLHSIVLDLDSVRDKNYLTHGLHPYAAKFIPQIPKAIIERFSAPRDLVVDPFCGSGTSLVEACLAGRDALGTDINPIGCLIARAKTCGLDDAGAGEIEKLLLELQGTLQRVRAYGDSGVPSAPPFNFPNQDHWFERSVLQELAYIAALVRSIRHSTARSLAATALSAIVVTVSRQAGETRWVAVSKRSYTGLTIENYLEKLTDVRTRALQFERHKASRCVVAQCDARTLPLRSQSAQLIVTSPPYVNTYDYYLYHKLRFFILGYENRPVEFAEIGSRHRHSDWGEGLDSYVSAMACCFDEFVRVLKPGGTIGLVVGDGVLRGELIDMGKVFRRLLSTAQLRLIGHDRFQQRKYTTSFSRSFGRHHKLSHLILAQKV